MANHLPSVLEPPRNLDLFLVLFLLSGPFLIEASETEMHYSFCGLTGSFTANSTYDENRSSLLASISSDDNVTYGFYNRSSGQIPDQVNAIALCRGDVSLSDCRACVQNTTIQIVQRCPLQKEGIILYDDCMLKYSDQSIFGVVQGYVYFSWSMQNLTDNAAEFSRVLGVLMDKLKSSASDGNSTRKFAIGTLAAPDFRTLYGLAQCTPDLSELQCNSCLADAIQRLPQCCAGRAGGRVVGPSCNIRYESGRFFNSDAEVIVLPPVAPEPSPNSTVPPTPAGNSSTWTIIIIALSSISAVCLLVISVLCIFPRKVREPIKNDDNAAMDEMGTAEFLQYDFETVRAATDDFSEENKLGQGGFGVVYKGELANGREIAVKRLSRGHGQGDQEFKTELMLVARLQHRNLVGLLGFCLTEEERLLVYEFMPLSSLDRFIFDPIKRQELDWERRQKIIGGIARGLLYLHEDSQLRIIHRDLKASNVLLDAEMTPKISDFGMAKLFVVDETHAATSRIVGTYGYMAPEYALYGQFSVKSDVFSFGILVLEIISGQKNNCFRSAESVEDLLSSVWRNWTEGTVSNIIDPLLSNGSRTKMLRCIHVGLLCVQENAANRPNMSSVLLMFNSFSITLPVPSQPALYMQSNMESSNYSSLARNNPRGAASDDSENNGHPSSINDVSITELLPR